MPACLATCLRKAIYKREDDGTALIDQERCRSYRKCVEACPYKKSVYRRLPRQDSPQRAGMGYAANRTIGDRTADFSVSPSQRLRASGKVAQPSA